jgi:Winged helix-turn helix
MGVKRCWVEIGGADRAELEHWLRLQNIPQALATRARIVLGSAAGESVSGLAARLGVTQTTVCLWRRRYRSAGLDGLRTKPRMGRPRRITSAKEQAVISATLRKPKAAGPRRPPAESNRPNASRRGIRTVRCSIEPGAGSIALAVKWRGSAAIRTWALLPSPPVPHPYGIVAICEGVRSFPEQCGCQKPGVCGGP